ncbi:MAG: hypothetical protein TREMPRED_003686 [Tremellales sp. Tagirdzhanova-0007]|nr:MAG: hypothetical protein TREMPRED_003686 [Tremellales sp. Tagirdzhanova-0007]
MSIDLTQSHTTPPLHPTDAHNRLCSEQSVTPQPASPRPVLTSDKAYEPIPHPPLQTTPCPCDSSVTNKLLPRTLLSKGTPHITPRTVWKKPSPSTPTKQKSVQLSLELKVERSRGFYPFFVPLARSMPPAPPSSPTLQTNMQPCLPDGDQMVDQSAKGFVDYFDSWQERVQEDPVKGPEEERMELDSG